MGQQEGNENDFDEIDNTTGTILQEVKEEDSL